jgi:predicted nucleotidyltransferase
MPDDPTTDPVLIRFRTAVKDLYGDRLARVVLYGSRARGDHHANSDYDIAVFLNDLSNRAIEMRRLADIETGILFDTEAVINALPVPGRRLPGTDRIHERSPPRRARPMKAATADYLAKAEECLEAAKKVIAIQLPAVAAKEAYLAAYHAAQACVFEASKERPPH